MFYYEQMFNTALSGIMSAGLMSIGLDRGLRHSAWHRSCLARMRHGPKAATFGHWA